jgi:outer membrane protein TolC
MNRDKTILFEVDTSYAIKSYSALLPDSLSISQNRSDVRAVENDIQLIALQQDVEKGKLKPEFGIRYDNMFGFGGLPMQYSLMGMVRLPMAKWSSRSSKANVESLKWKAESLNRQKQSMINEATGISYGLQREIESKQKQINLFQDNILPALHRNFRTMQLGYEQNTEELFALYDAWETLNKTRMEWLDQLQDLYLMQVELERVLEIK